MRILGRLALAFHVAGAFIVPPMAATAGENPFKCQGIVNGGTISSNVNVEAGAVCRLISVNVTGDVSVGKGAELVAFASSISGSVSADEAQSVFIFQDSSVGGSVIADYTNTAFIESTGVGGKIDVRYGGAPGSGSVEICGSGARGGISVSGFAGQKILIGDPMNPAGVRCGGNGTDATSQILVTNITTDTEIHVNGNFTNGDVAVYFNTGAGDKQVTGNYTFMGDIFCTANFAPFTGGPNVTAGDVEGDQCTATTITGVDPV